MSATPALDALTRAQRLAEDLEHLRLHPVERDHAYAYLYGRAMGHLLNTDKDMYEYLHMLETAVRGTP